eukprot:TRINITY_DN2573_c0_g2_i2.p2 TRINITY_DN2573_c0_g2~~TRINITY_DN2573_c0_g2_i2.p2  ORF type:complete len:1404 (-),score=332.74 TRINITY_DN2573_c0_g2_i2:142-4353(-)
MGVTLLPQALELPFSGFPYQSTVSCNSHWAVSFITLTAHLLHFLKKPHRAASLLELFDAATNGAFSLCVSSPTPVVEKSKPQQQRAAAFLLKAVANGFALRCTQAGKGYEAITRSRNLAARYVSSRQTEAAQAAVFSAYQSAIKLLAMEQERVLLIQARNEAGDFMAAVRKDDEAMEMWSNGVDQIFGMLDAADNLSTVSTTFTKPLEQLGLWQCLMGGCLLAKLARRVSTHNLSRCNDLCLQAALLLAGVFGTSHAHPQRPADFATYTPTSLVPSCDLGDPYKFPVTQIVCSCEYIAWRLIAVGGVCDRFANAACACTALHALPVLSLCEYLASRCLRSAHHVALSRVLRARALIKLGFMAEAFYFLTVLFQGEGSSASKSGPLVFSNNLPPENATNFSAIRELCQMKLDSALSATFGIRLVAQIYLARALLVTTLATFSEQPLAAAGEGDAFRQFGRGARKSSANRDAKIPPLSPVSTASPSIAKVDPRTMILQWAEQQLCTLMDSLKKPAQPPESDGKIRVYPAFSLYVIAWCHILRSDVQAERSDPAQACHLLKEALLFCANHASIKESTSTWYWEAITEVDGSTLAECHTRQIQAYLRRHKFDACSTLCTSAMQDAAGFGNDDIPRYVAHAMAMIRLFQGNVLAALQLYLTPTSPDRLIVHMAKHTAALRTYQHAHLLFLCGKEADVDDMLAEAEQQLKEAAAATQPSCSGELLPNPYLATSAPRALVYFWQARRLLKKRHYTSAIKKYLEAYNLLSNYSLHPSTYIIASLYHEAGCAGTESLLPSAGRTLPTAPLRPTPVALKPSAHQQQQPLPDYLAFAAAASATKVDVREAVKTVAGSAFLLFKAVATCSTSLCANAHCTVVCALSRLALLHLARHVELLTAPASAPATATSSDAESAALSAEIRPFAFYVLQAARIVSMQRLLFRDSNLVTAPLLAQPLVEKLVPEAIAVELRSYLGSRGDQQASQESCAAPATLTPTRTAAIATSPSLLPTPTSAATVAKKSKNTSRSRMSLSTTLSQDMKQGEKEVNIAAVLVNLTKALFNEFNVWDLEDATNCIALASKMHMYLLQYYGPYSYCCVTPDVTQQYTPACEISFTRGLAVKWHPTAMEDQMLMLYVIGNGTDGPSSKSAPALMAGATTVSTAKLVAIRESIVRVRQSIADEAAMLWCGSATPLPKSELKEQLESLLRAKFSKTILNVVQECEQCFGCEPPPPPPPAEKPQTEQALAAAPAIAPAKSHKHGTSSTSVAAGCGEMRSQAFAESVVQSELALLFAFLQSQAFALQTPAVTTVLAPTSVAASTAAQSPTLASAQGGLLERVGQSLTLLAALQQLTDARSPAPACSCGWLELTGGGCSGGVFIEGPAHAALCAWLLETLTRAATSREQQLKQQQAPAH